MGCFNWHDRISEAITEDLGLNAEALYDPDIILVEEYEIEILQQPILEELEMRIEFAEIRTIEDEFPYQRDSLTIEDGKCREIINFKPIHEDLIIEKRLPEENNSMWR
eukprot:Seg161.5 transcript_id=Seg161.5/GoldUCD/mRNA.D3Y31 product="hypothetical protein" protein_id=Seg161.5/GoldUCD/D3Y31